MTSIYHCEQCGGLLASREELTEGACLACQFDCEWQRMQDERARRMVADAIRQSPKSRAAGEQTVTVPLPCEECYGTGITQPKTLGTMINAIDSSRWAPCVWCHGTGVTEPGRKGA